MSVDHTLAAAGIQGVRAVRLGGRWIVRVLGTTHEVTTEAPDFSEALDQAVSEILATTEIHPAN